MSAESTALPKALLEIQKEIKNAAMDSTNPHFKNKYASLESVIDAVRGVANTHGVSIIQIMGKDELGDYVETRLMHETGAFITSKLYLHLDKPTMQALGSAISYARRYALAAIFSITQADDDGNDASVMISTGKNVSNRYGNFTNYGPPSDYDTFTKIPPIGNVTPTISTHAPSEGNGSYVCKVGKKYNGMTLAEIGVEDVKSYKNWIIKNSKEKNKEITGDWFEFIVEADKFVNEDVPF